MAPAAASFTVATDYGRMATILTVAVPATTVKLSIWRVGPSGAIAGVRSVYPLTGLSGLAQTLVIRDFEVPLDVDVYYRSRAFDAGDNPGPIYGPVHHIVGADASPMADDWLCDLMRSANTRQVRVESIEQLGYEAQQGVHHVLGRRTPVVTSDVVGTPTMQLVFTTDEWPDAPDALRTALGTGAPVLLRTPPDRGVGNMYLQPSSWTEQRISRIAFAENRRFTVDCQQVDRPDPTLFKPIAPVNYADVKANYGTYTNVTTLAGTYDDLQYDYGAAGTSGTQLVQWPARDV